MRYRHLQFVCIHRHGHDIYGTEINAHDIYGTEINAHSTGSELVSFLPSLASTSEQYLSQVHSVLQLSLLLRVCVSVTS